jgi:hypothetical protein
MLGGIQNSAIVANSYDFQTSTGWATPFTDQTGERIGLAMTPSGTGIAVARSVATGELRYALWNGSWLPGFGQPLMAVEADLTIVGGPALALSGERGDVAYQRPDLKYSYAAIQSGLWSPKKETIGNGADQSAGPVPPAIAEVSGDPFVVFVGDDADLHDRRRQGGVWQAATLHGIAGTVASITPAVVALASGPELLVVFADAATHGLRYSTRTAGVWSAPLAIAGASSDATVALAPLPASGAVLGYRATDGTMKAAVFSPSEVPAWSEPPGLAALPVIGVPAVASGAVGARAELLYVNMANLVYGSRLVAGSWTAPTLQGSSGEQIAITTGL